MSAYRLKVPNGTYAVTLKFCEPHYDRAGKRVFGVKLQDKQVIDKLDVFEKVGKNKALDFTYKDVQVSGGLLEIEFVKVVEFPCIAAIVVEGQNITRKINCGGPALKDYEADLQDVTADGRSRDLSASDFYADWATTEFGAQAAEQIAKLFVNLDGTVSVVSSGQQGTRLPRPSTWVNGPGGINPHQRPWEQVKGEYAFVDELAGLRPQVKGAGNLERFDYWLNNFRYLRAVGLVNCTWAKFNAAMQKVKAENDPNKGKQIARETALPVRQELIEQVSEVHRYLLETVSTNGEMGTVANWQQHLLPTLLSEPGRELAKILGEELPADARPTNRYNGSPRIIVPTVRTSIMADEDLKLKVMFLSKNPVKDAALYWRPMGKGEFRKIPIAHVARSVYSVKIPASEIEEIDLEYYITAEADNRTVTFPATAPYRNQTVVIMRGGE